MMMKALRMLLIFCLLSPAFALAETVNDQSNVSLPEPVYSLFDAQGKLITRVHADCSVGDEYISGDNRHFRVSEVDDASFTAIAEDLGTAEMPDVSWLSMERSQPVSANASAKKIALYCTHSDESYESGDGTSSNEERGGIYDVAKRLAAALEELGVTVERSDALHHPHDAGAYRRSRQTAVQLLKGMPDAIFDIHRDGIPDPDEYAVTIGDVKMSKVRLLVGRGNQNKDANLSLAKQIKAVGDKLYPKLIKDIYMGKGSYNQDLAPRSVLLEFGTHTLDKERVLRSADPMSEVLYKTLYGGVTGAAGASDVSGSAGQQEKSTAAEQSAGKAEDEKSAGGGIVWLIVAIVAGLLIFAFLSGGGFTKFKRSFSEMTGGLMGKKPPES